jgi:hypothetical protein
MKRAQLTLYGAIWALSTSSCTSSDTSADATSTADGSADSAPCASAAYTENVTACTPATTDYQPRKGKAGANGWPKCISDDNAWHLIGSGLPAAASRSKAFETMATKLWKKSQPTKADFLSARDDYSVSEGLASRIARRQDVSYDEVPGSDKFACSNAGVPDKYPDRCAGPAKLEPIIDDAFQKGIAQTQPDVQAARIEAALIWFFYLSMTSEVWTCGFDDITDCDSAAGYYTQVSARGTPAGLARYVSSLGLETHDRIYDALLAERCWRDIDQTMPATDTYKSYYTLALKQLDKATLRGEALILRERIGRILCTSGDAQEANIAFVKILGGVLDHGAGLVDTTKAAQLKTYTSSPTTDAAAAASAQAVIDSLFACP